MSTSAKRFRRRGYGGGDDAVSLPPAPSTTGRNPASITTKSSSSSKPKKLLSFADDDEEEGGPAPKLHGSSKPPPNSSSRAPKHPASSHILTSSKGRATPTLAFSTSNIQSPAGTYTKETLLELHKNMLKVAKPSSEPRIIREDEEEDDDVEAGIPDEETIKKTRDKRERMRQAKGLAQARDYISLEGASVLDGASGGGLRDDDDEDEDEDEEDAEKRVSGV